MGSSRARLKRGSGKVRMSGSMKLELGWAEVLDWCWMVMVMVEETGAN